MIFFKDRQKWCIALAGFFLTAMLATALCLSALTNDQPPPDAITPVYMGLAAISVTGGLAIWSAWHFGGEASNEGQHAVKNTARNDSPWTNSPSVANDACIGKGSIHENGHARKLITIYSKEKNIRYISPEAEDILGYRKVEMIGESDLENVHPDHRHSFDYIFTRLGQNPKEKIKLQYAYKTRKGSYIWLESTAANGLSDPDINGYLLETTDVTAQKLEEQATRMRSKIQALSENSPDLIVRIEEGRISYINPVIEYYTGLDPAAFLNRKILESGLDESVVKCWSDSLLHVRQTGGKAVLDMEFPSQVGKRIMQVNAIPEYDARGLLESVLLVSHDITERKRIELEVRHQNKKISESIHYARRIQGAILPNPRLIHRALPDSFILYKPRDMVSGDFPWFTQVREETFMAAVDCTGHGVPGALLSLVGYFLLNDIVRSRKITEPGKILDLLDESVATTLRPNEDAGTKDGMDICLCRINTASREVVFAGAHRPLYVVRSGVLEEIKGNKFPIGGGIFKNQTSFTSSKLNLDHGDSIYFGSDGFCDQFGGPGGKKFGTTQLRQLISRVHTMPMTDAKAVIEHEWENWKGNQKQTDDVLLIGIKF